MNPDVFLIAAELVDEADMYSCNAVSRAVRKGGGKCCPLTGRSPERVFYAKLMQIESYTFCDSRSHRVFALLLAYEIAKDEARTALRARWKKNSKAYRARQWRRLEVGERRQVGDEWQRVNSHPRGQWVRLSFVEPGTEIITLGGHLPHRRRVTRKEGGK